MKHTKRFGAAVGALVAASLVLAGCAPAAETDTASAEGAIVEAIPAYPGSFAVDNFGGADTFEIVQATNANLIRNPYIESAADPESMTQDLYDWEGVLAESYDVSEDGLVYTFHLRQGVLSQAGNPFTADDVLWSFERKWNAETTITPEASLPALTDPTTQIAKIDDHTVTFTLAAAGHGFPFLAVISKFLYHIYDSTLLKEHATAEDPYAVQWSADNGNYGYGAYMIESTREGEEVVLVANPNYPLGEPDIKRITQRVVADPASRALLVRNGDVDAATQLTPADVVDLASDPNVSTFTPDTNMYTYAMMNVTKAPLDNVSVREALFYAIPYDQIIEQVYRGRANPAVGFLDPSNPERITEGLLDHVYDPAQSMAILEAAGVSTPVDLTIVMSAATPDLEETAIQMQSFGQEAGFNFSIEVVPTPTVEEQVRTKSYDLRLWRDFVISYESVPYTLELWHPRLNPVNNMTGWGTPEYYAAIDAGIAAGDSLSPEAAQYWHEAELAWQEGYHTIEVANVLPLTAFRNTLTGFSGRTEGIVDWSIVSFS